MPQTTSPAASAIIVESLTRRFDDVIAVDQVSFSIAVGEIFGLIGPNGAGKSTLIKMLTTLLPPSTGTASVAGFDIVRQPASVRRHIGYVPQMLSADGSLTGLENLWLSARLYGVPRQKRTERINRALDRMGLAQAGRHLVSHYSGGMIRRLEIAQCLLHRPAVLFLDEPTVGLDPQARETVWQRVLELRDRFHRTLVVTTHHLEEVDAFCDRIALIDHGRIVAIGSLAELKARISPSATLDDVFIQLTAGAAGNETGEGYGQARQARRAASEHG